MQKLVSTIAGLTLLVSIISSGMPRVTHAADTANVPPPSWPHTITTADATIVVYQPQAVAWQAYRTLEVRVAVAVIRQGTQQPILGVLDGEPLLSAIQGTDLSFVVNTNWDVFFDPSTATYYLLDGQFWLSAPHYTGPWQPVAQLPPAFNTLPNDQNFADVKEHIPGIVIQAQDLPRIFVSTQPAEIILTNGPPTLITRPACKGSSASRTSMPGARVGRAPATSGIAVSARALGARDSKEAGLVVAALAVAGLAAAGSTVASVARAPLATP